MPVAIPGFQGTNAITMRKDTEDSQNAGIRWIFDRSEATSSYDYGLRLSGSKFFTGTTATKSRALGITCDRPSGSVATGDSNDAALYISVSNYAACDSNFIFRAVNAVVNNRSGGTLAIIENTLAASSKSGSTTPTVRALQLTAENYGTCATEFGGLDIVLKNEGAVATTEYGMRIRNNNNSIAGPVASAISISKSGANTGFTNLFNIGASAGMYTEAGTYTAGGTAVKLACVVNGTTYYVLGSTAPT